VIEASGDAESLARLARERLSPGAGPLLFLRGAEVAADLAALLAADGFEVRETIVYQAVAAKSVPLEVAALMEGGAFTAALFFSPRTARIFAALAAPWHAALGNTVAVAISARAASPLADSGFAAVVVAASPDEGAMLSALGAASRGLVQAAAPRYDSLKRKEAEP
jgi:uroporphyrinogen-III synthase